MRNSILDPSEIWGGGGGVGVRGYEEEVGGNLVQF